MLAPFSYLNVLFMSFLKASVLSLGAKWLNSVSCPLLILCFWRSGSKWLEAAVIILPVWGWTNPGQLGERKCIVVWLSCQAYICILVSLCISMNACHVQEAVHSAFGEIKMKKEWLLTPKSWFPRKGAIMHTWPLYKEVNEWNWSQIENSCYPAKKSSQWRLWCILLMTL